MNENELSKLVIGAALRVHKELGPGLLESAYQTCLRHELKKRGISVESERNLSVVYDDIEIDAGYRIDLLVEGKLVIEIKCADKLHPIHIAQTLTYLRIGGFKLGLLMNFNVLQLTHGIKRVVNGL